MLMTPCYRTASSICIQALLSYVLLSEVSVCWVKEQTAALGGPGSRKGAGSSLQIKARNSAAQPLRVSERGDKTGTKCKMQPPRIQV